MGSNPSNGMCCFVVYVTQSGKISCIAHDSKFDFSPITQSYMNNYQISLSRLEWIAFAGCSSGDLYKRSGALMEL